jgi:deoxyribose-phosphate aldolase
VRDELAAVVAAAQGCPVKVILETAALSASELEPACDAAQAAGAAYVKTSTGFHPGGGATLEAVAALRRTVGGVMGVKASGGIRDPADAVAMLRAGADRIGTSSAAHWSDLIGLNGPTVAALLG